MKGLLIVLCVLAVLVAAFAGGCAGLITLLFAGPSDVGVSWITVPAILAAVAIFTTNVALFAAVGRGTLSRRRPLFLGLAVLDIVASVYLAAVAWVGFGGAPIALNLVLGFLAKGFLVFSLRDEAEPGWIASEPPVADS